MLPKEKIERRHTHSFWECLGEFPDSVLRDQKPPEPDFFVKTNEGLIGIEHTRLVRQRDEREVDMMGHYQCAEKIMEQAEEKFRSQSTLKLYVSVNFRCDHGLSIKTPAFLSNADIKPLATFIANLVISNIPPLAAHQRFERYDPYKRRYNFPPDKKIEAINIWNLDHISPSCWTPAQAAVIPRVWKSAAFKKALKKKNEKPKNYQKDYHQIWLLMVEDRRDLTTYFDFKNSKKPTVSSPFDKIFVFRYAEKEIIELTTVAT